MISKNEIRELRSLQQKKFRESENKFIAEGINNVEEGLKSCWKCSLLIYTENFQRHNKEIIKSGEDKKIRHSAVSENDFERISGSVTPQGILGVFDIPGARKINFAKISEPVIYLDGISDPGNAGTIIRTCDWFGFTNIMLSRNSADIFNSKTVRSTAGSLFHVDIYQDHDLEDYYSELQEHGFEIYASDMEGESIYSCSIPSKSIVVFSNEANGMSGIIMKMLDQKICIPSFGSAESLNVASAAAIILAEIRNRILNS